MATTTRRPRTEAQSKVPACDHAKLERWGRVEFCLGCGCTLDGDTHVPLNQFPAQVKSVKELAREFDKRRRASKD